MGPIAKWHDRIIGLERLERGLNGCKLLPAAISPTRTVRFARNWMTVTDTVMRRAQVRWNPQPICLSRSTGRGSPRSCRPWWPSRTSDAPVGPISRTHSWRR